MGIGRYTGDLSGEAHKKIRTDPRNTLNNPERCIDLIVSFPVKHRDDVGQNVKPPRGEGINSCTQRMDIIKTLHAAGLQLTESLTTDGERYLFRVSAPNELMEVTAEKMGIDFSSKLLNSQEDTQKGLWPGFAPYVHENQHLYEKSKLGYFKPVERQIMIKYIIERAMGGDGVRTNKIDSLREQEICDIYPTHSPNEQAELITMWASFGLKCLTTKQPIEKVRDYFGEEIAIYFAYLGLYTDWLHPAAFTGILTTYVQSTDDTDPSGDSVFAWGNGAFIVIWATLFLRFWERKQNCLQVQWDVKDFENEEINRFEFEGDWKTSPITLELEKVFTDKQRRKRYFASGAIMLCCLLAVIANSAMVILIKQKMKDKFGAMGGSVGGGVNAVTVLILNSVYNGIAYHWTNHENHQTKTQYDDSLIVKLFLFEFVNSFATIFFMAYMATRLDLMGTSIECETSCLSEVKSLTQSLVLVNLAVGNVTETLLPYLKHKQAQEDIKREEQNVNVYHSAHEVEGTLATYEGTFEDYNEIVLQFATVTVFALAYPLGALLALLNNLIEIRSDAFKLVQVTQRPFNSRGQDIGSWFSILKIVVTLATINNCALAGFTSQQFTKKGWVDNDAGGQVKKLAILFAVEHLLFFITFVISEFAVAAEPAFLNSAEIRLKKRKFKALRTQVQREEHETTLQENRSLHDLLDESDVVPLEDVTIHNWRGQPQYGHQHLRNNIPPEVIQESVKQQKHLDDYRHDSQDVDIGHDYIFRVTR